MQVEMDKIDAKGINDAPYNKGELRELTHRPRCFDVRKTAAVWFTPSLSFFAPHFSNGCYK